MYTNHFSNVQEHRLFTEMSFYTASLTVASFFSTTAPSLHLASFLFLFFFLSTITTTLPSPLSLHPLCLCSKWESWLVDDKVGQICRYERWWINDDIYKDRGVFARSWGTCKYTHLLQVLMGQQKKKPTAFNSTLFPTSLRLGRSVNKCFIVYYLWICLLFTSLLSALSWHTFVVFR